MYIPFSLLSKDDPTEPRHRRCHYSSLRSTDQIEVRLVTPALVLSPTHQSSMGRWSKSCSLYTRSASGTISCLPREVQREKESDWGEQR